MSLPGKSNCRYTKLSLARDEAQEVRRAKGNDRDYDNADDFLGSALVTADPPDGVIDDGENS